MSTLLKPMLAANAPADLEQLTYPLYGSAKLDGIRCLIKDGKALSRTLKPLPNKHIQSLLSNRPELEGLDGELTVGAPTAQNLMQATTSAVMSRDGEPDFCFRVFDNWNRTIPYDTYRWYMEHEAGINASFLDSCVQWHPQTILNSVAELEQFEIDIVSQGYEGVITRLPLSPYKFGRSTLNQEFLLKIKRFQQDEAVIIGTEPLYHNANELERDERGYAKRASFQENKIPLDMLGALRCELLGFPGLTFNIGTGFTEMERKLLWQRRNNLPGQIVSFKHFAKTGVKTAPRHPVFVSFRNQIDL